MIIKNHSSVSKKKLNGKIILGLGLLSLFAVLTYTLSFISPKPPTGGQDIVNDNFTLIANAEQVEENRFVLGDYSIDLIHQQSSDCAYQGNYSFKLQGPKSKYGLAHKIKNVQVGDYIVARVWVRPTNGMSGCLVLKSYDKATSFYQQSCKPIFTKEEWQLIEVLAHVTSAVQDNELELYCYNASNFPVYFDNLQLYISKEPIQRWKPEDIHLVIKEGEFKKLEAIREEALDLGLLITNDDSWVKGAIFPKDKTETKTKVDLRLKGDWLDHLKGDKWSFRVKTETNKSWNRLKVFSLQDPVTRSYLKEWLLHEFFKYEDILTTRYEFVNLKINQEEKGLYVYEEHFLKQIPEYNLRREGPIVKFTENGLWEARLNAEKLGISFVDVDHKANPDIRPFGENKTVKSPTLANQFNIAQNLCYEYQYNLKPAKDIFDLDLLAKYYAILDVTGAHHGLIWHNQRFYYNPVIGKLEPIGFDGYDEYGQSWIKQPFVGFDKSLAGRHIKNPWYSKIFNDPDFLKKYLFYLNQFAEKKYLDTFIDSIAPELTKRQFYIKEVLPEYNFSTNFLYNRASAIKEGMLPTANSLHNRTLAKGKIALCNFHNVPLEVIGSKTSREGPLTLVDSPLIVYTRYYLPSFDKVVTVPENAKYLAYQVIGWDSTFLVEINPWPVPEAYTPMQELSANLVEGHAAYYYDKENKHILFKDSAFIKEPIIIPAGHRVEVEAGSYLDISNKAFVVSYSAVNFMGNAEQPIIVNSSDGTANGFTVLKAKEMSYIYQTVFQNMNTLAYKGWNLTGAVTFYEADVKIYNSVFTKNHCEDALNIIRSDFYLKNSTISHTFADGLDADFCFGTIENCNFLKTGNDGLDFSTSRIYLSNTSVKQAGDKGVSVGEQGFISIYNIQIDGANIGIASKDFSEVLVHTSALKNCTQGFAAYQKKPEYGGAKITVHQYTSENVATLYKILPGSSLKLINKEIKGN